MKLDLYLHLGAHRTGSTTLQLFAQAHSAGMQAAGVSFWGPQATRDGRMAALIKAADRVSPALARDGRNACADLQGQIARLETGALVVSEENMLGSMFANVRERRLYDDAARRLARFRPAFAQDCRRIGLAIRSYDRQWASSLGYVMRKEQRGTNRAELAELAAQSRRWRHVIAEIAAVFPEAELLVWPFEALVDDPAFVLHAIVGDRLDQKLPAFCDMHHHPSPDCAKLRAEMPDGPARASIIGEGPWSPFDSADRARMRAAYAEDITWLRAGADGLARYIETPELKSPGSTEGLPGLTRGTDHDQSQRRVG